MDPNQYLESLELKPAENVHEIYGYLLDKYGAIAEEFIDAIRQEIEGTDKTVAPGRAGRKKYVAKNRSYEFSYDISALWWGDYILKVAAYLREIDCQPKRILDLGCENGVITNFLATLYPSAQVLGIDTCSVAVDVAREHARRLGIRNVEFRQADVLNLDEALPDESYDLITSLLLFNEVMRFPSTENDEPIGWSYREWELPAPIESITTALTSLRKKISPDGMLISIERCTSGYPVAWWIRQLATAGWQAERGEPFRFDDAGGAQVVPAIILKASDDTTLPDVTAALAFYEGRTASDIIEEIRLSATGRFFRARAYKSEFFLDVADALVGNDAVRVLEIDYPKQNACERHELRINEQFLCYLHYTTLGYMELHVDRPRKKKRYMQMIDSIEEGASYSGRTTRRTLSV